MGEATAIMEAYKTFTCPDCGQEHPLPEKKAEDKSPVALTCEKCGVTCQVLVLLTPPDPK